jgi:hypothetical protein
MGRLAKVLRRDRQPLTSGQGYASRRGTNRLTPVPRAQSANEMSTNATQSGLMAFVRRWGHGKTVTVRYAVGKDREPYGVIDASDDRTASVARRVGPAPHGGSPRWGRDGLVRPDVVPDPAHASIQPAGLGVRTDRCSGVCGATQRHIAQSTASGLGTMSCGLRDSRAFMRAIVRIGRATARAPPGSPRDASLRRGAGSATRSPARSDLRS